MNPLDAQGLQSSPLTNPAAASSSGASSSSSTDEKISQVVSANESGPHAAAGASSQSLEGCKLQQEAPPRVVLDLSDESLSDEDRITQIQNSGEKINLVRLGYNRLSKGLLEQISEHCPRLQEVELCNWQWKLDHLIQAQGALPKGVLLTNPDCDIASRAELKKYLDYCAPFGGPTCLNLVRIRDLTQSELDELIERAPNLHRLSVKSNQLTELNAPKATWVDCEDCTNLQSISAPKATTINCGDCTGLQSISAPSATWIDCQRCTGLQSISAPKATNIFCGGCTGLQSLNVPLSAFSVWKENPQRSLERLQMGAKMPSPEEMTALETSHPELAQKMRKLTVLTLQDLARNCIHGNSQIETEGFPAPLLQYEDIETTYPQTLKNNS